MSSDADTSASPGTVDSSARDDPEQAAPADLPDGRFADREMSWLAFNRRVLELARDESIPLLERVRFLAIFASNLDEFFMVRVAGLKRRLATGLAVRAASGMQPREVLAAVASEAHELVELHSACFQDDVRPKLSAAGIEVVPWEELTTDERGPLHAMFAERILPVLTPLAVDPAHPFPYISGLSLNLAVITESPGTGKERFARVKVPPLLPRLIDVGTGRFVPLEDVIREHLPQLFPGMRIVRAHSFRVTRNEDVEVEEDDAENLLQALERELMRRRFGPPVRLEVESSIDPHVLDLLLRELEVTETDVYRMPAPLDLTGLGAIADLDRADLRYPPFVPARHPALAEVETAKPSDIFAAISAGDVLLHHPYDSFSTSVQAFLEQAAADPHVLAIKQTLYRTSGDSPIVDALVDAAEAGKQVLVLVEIKARFDEKANIRWARTLEEAGCHVVYGLIGLKTHAKISLVVRDEPDGLRRYAHIGTGNYNPKTARLYEDLGLLTADQAIGEDLSALFNALSGYSRDTRYRQLLVAPHSLRAGLLQRIDEQIAEHRAGREGYIGFKLNSLTDEAIVDALYRASQAGVPVDLSIRGICAVRPGVPGMSETIRVRSVLGRFLEHSRILVFGRGVDAHAFIGSADMMHRNLDRRIEALVRVQDPKLVAELTEMVDRTMAEDTSSWWLGPDGDWTRHDRDADGTPAHDMQVTTMRRAHRRTAGG